RQDGCGAQHAAESFTRVLGAGIGASTRTTVSRGDRPRAGATRTCSPSNTRASASARSPSMSRMHPVTILMAAAALSACSTVQRVGHMFSGGQHHDVNAEPQGGRISILATDPALTPDAPLPGHPLTPPSPL